MNKTNFTFDVLACMQEQVYIRDLDMNIMYINPASERLTGYTLEEARGKKCYEIFGDEQTACRYVCPVEKAIAEAHYIQHHEGDLKTRGGDVRKMRVSISPLYEDNRVSGAAVVMQDITELKNLEETHVKTLIALEKEVEARKTSEHNLERAQSVAGVGSWHLNIPSRVLTWSEETYHMFGVEKGTSIDTEKFLAQVHPADRQLVKTSWQAALKGSAYDLEHRIIVDDSERWVHEKAEFSFTEDGSPIEAVGTVLDITDKRLFGMMNQVERDIAAQWSRSSTLEERLGACLEAAISASSLDCGGIYLVNESDGSLSLMAHRGLSEAFIKQVEHYPAGSPNARLIQKGEPVYTTHEELFENTDSSTSSENLRAIAVIPIIYQGQVIACINVASRTKENMPEDVKSILQNISVYTGAFIAQEIHEERRRQSRRDLELLVNTIDDMLFVLELDGTIIKVNKVVSQNLGYDEEELSGRHVLMLLPESLREEARSVVESMIAGKVDAYPIPLLTKDMRPIPMETKVKLGQWDGKQVIIGVGRDISVRMRLEAERISLEKQRQQIEKAESLSAMAAAVAHNFNNMLTGVIGNLDLVLSKMSSVDPNYRRLFAANKSAEKAAETSRLMLTYLGQIVANSEPCDLAEICQQRLENLRVRVGEKAKLSVDLPGIGPVIEADAGQVGQIIDNLVNNAIEATATENCEVEIAVGTMRRDDNIFKAHLFPVGFEPKVNEYACLSVTDAGRGIEEARLNRIFDPFYSDKFTGRGLGLAVTLGIVRSLNGCIIVESEPGKGSCFHVLIPLAFSSQDRACHFELSEAGETRGVGTVLLVEDTESVREVSKAMLEHLGFDVLVAEDGPSALKLFKENQESVRLVVSDYTMPKMNGWETLTALRRMQSNLPVILVSGLDEAKVMAGEHSEWPEVFLHKPYRFSSLAAAVRKALGGNPSSATS